MQNSFECNFYYAHMLILVCFDNLYRFNYDMFAYPRSIGRVGSASQYDAGGRVFKANMLQKILDFIITYAFFVFLTFIFFNFEKELTCIICIFAGYDLLHDFALVPNIRPKIFILRIS